MRTVFFVHQLSTGEQLTLEMQRAAFGDALRVCRFRRDVDCCGAAACARASEFDRVGYRLFVQERADDGALDAPKSGDLVLVQVREPTLRALDGYTRDLAESGRAHSVERLQSWLAGEALRTVDFWRRWSAAPRGFVLRVEALAASARETLDAVLSAARLQLDDEALARAAATVAAAGPPSGEVSLRVLEADPHFVRPYFVEFLNLLAEEADYLGYPLWQERKPASGPVTTLYRARRALGERQFEEVLAVLAPFVAVNVVEPEVRAMLGEALLEAGREVEGRRALDGLLRSDPDHLEAYGILARHAYRLGLVFEGRAFLRLAMARRDGMRWTRGFLERSKADHDLLREFPQIAEPAVSREAVVAGFTWILGRAPESDAVVEVHRGLHDDDDLRLSLLRSQEFREFHARFEAGDESAPMTAEAVTRDDLLQAVRWLLGRPLRSRDEADDLLKATSRAALRLRLVGEQEFRSAWRHVAEGF